MRKKERFVLGKRTFRSQKSKHFVLRIITFSDRRILYNKNFRFIKQKSLACDKPEIFYVYNGNHLSVEKEYEESMTDSAMNVSW